MLVDGVDGDVGEGEGEEGEEEGDDEGEETHFGGGGVEDG